ncbi:MAG: site-specific integrase [Hyphomicrobiales bacterium]|nr:MAG: site-specific integrase [Hyphomicrobiales bacterium]
MPSLQMTDAWLRTLKPSLKRDEYWDERTQGLCLRVTPSNVRTWSLRYVPPGSKEYRRLTLGQYPALSLAAARERVIQTRAGVSGGADPQKERVEARAASARVRTFGKLAERYIDEYAKRTKKSWEGDELLLRVHVLPSWAEKRADRITRADASALLDEIAKRSPSSANRSQTVINKTFNWAVDSGLLSGNPSAGMRKRGGKEKPKDRVLSETEVRLFWRLVETGRVAPAITAALRLIFLTGARPGEISGISLEEIRDIADPKAALIEVPAGRMKNGRPHVIPLSPMARALVVEQLGRLAKDDTHLFASSFHGRGPIARHSLSQTLGKLIKALDPDSGDPAVVSMRAKPPTPHDLRRTCATGLAALRVPREVRLAVLAHAPTDVMGVHYDRHDLVDEKREALTLWAEKIVSILESGR